jgi:hypothetical protein
MATHVPSLNIPRPINYHVFARNGLPVMGGYARKVWRAHNHTLAYRRKMVCSHSDNIQSLNAGESGETDVFFGRLHTGYGASKLWVNVGMASPDSTAASNPKVSFYLNGSQTGNELYTQYVNESDDTFSEFSWGNITADVSAATDYNWKLTATDYSRPFAIAIWEVSTNPVDDSAAGAVDERISVTQPMLDSQHEDIFLDQDKIWKRNACHLYHWTTSRTANSPTFTSGTYTNVWDSSTTGGASTTTPSIYLNVANHDTFASTNVPVAFYVHAEMIGGAQHADNAVKLVDDSNTTLLTISNIGTTAQWYGTTGNLTAGTILASVEAKVRVLINYEMRIDAISLYSYEA